MRKIGVVTTGRCDYGLYLPILQKITLNRRLTLSLYVTGMHLCREFGDTVKIIEQDGFSIAAKVDILSGSDSPFDIAKSMGEATIKFAQVFQKDCPDILLVLGDRFEMHSAAVAAIPFNIPIAHIHGGEITYGAFDEYFRHSLTKLSQIHFASTKEYASRIKQMGEEPKRIFVSGSPAIDTINNTSRYSKEKLKSLFNLSFDKPVFLVTFHPATIEYRKTGEYMDNLLNALAAYENYNIIFTAPNADTNRNIITGHIKSFIKKHANAFYVVNFGSRGYLSIMQYAKLMVGNSSSGIIEAASFKLPVVNIGTRQQGRIRGKNVIDVGYASGEIKKGIKMGLSDKFRRSLNSVKNLYGDGKASDLIVRILATVDLEKIKVKHFFDLSFKR